MVDRIVPGRQLVPSTGTARTSAARIKGGRGSDVGVLECVDALIGEGDGGGGRGVFDFHAYRIGDGQSPYFKRDGRCIQSCRRQASPGTVCDEIRSGHQENDIRQGARGGHPTGCRVVSSRAHEDARRNQGHCQGLCTGGRHRPPKQVARHFFPPTGGACEQPAGPTEVHFTEGRKP